MYQLSASEITFVAGVVCGAVAGFALLIVPWLRRLLLAAAFCWLAWRLYESGPQNLGGELLAYVRVLAAQGDFLRGALLAKAGVGLSALLARRRAS